MTQKFTQVRKDAFLAALRVIGNQTLAAERAKVSRSWVQLHRGEDPAFRSAVERKAAPDADDVAAQALSAGAARD